MGEEIRQRILEAQHFLTKVLPLVVKSTVFLREHNARVGNFFESQMLPSENRLLALLHFLKKLCFIGIYIPAYKVIMQKLVFNIPATNIK